jgi:hypothetical protein
VWLCRADLHQAIAANSFITFCNSVGEDHGECGTVRHRDIKTQLSAVYSHSARTRGASAEIKTGFVVVKSAA